MIYRCEKQTSTLDRMIWETQFFASGHVMPIVTAVDFKICYAGRIEFCSNNTLRHGWNLEWLNQYRKGALCIQHGSRQWISFMITSSELKYQMWTNKQVSTCFILFLSRFFVFCVHCRPESNVISLCHLFVGKIPVLILNHKNWIQSENYWTTSNHNHSIKFIKRSDDLSLLLN